MKEHAVTFSVLNVPTFAFCVQQSSIVIADATAIAI